MGYMPLNVVRYPLSITLVSVEMFVPNKEAWWKSMQLTTVVFGNTILAWISVFNCGMFMR